MENKMFRLALKGTLVLLFMAYTLHASDFAVKLEDVRKVQDRVYTGTAGKSQLTVYTEECFHETTKGEWASFTWYGSDGIIAFGSNADQCHVKSYKTN
jgi:hypothetical protein